MFFVSDALLDQILADDIPYGDATTALLGIEIVPGIVRCRPKAETTIAGVTLAERLFARVGCRRPAFMRKATPLPPAPSFWKAAGRPGPSTPSTKQLRTFWSTPQA